MKEVKCFVHRHRAADVVHALKAAGFNRLSLSPGMLQKTRQRTAHAGWQNVELVESDMSEYRFPVSTNGVLANTDACHGPKHDGIIERAAESLVGTRIADMEVKWPIQPVLSNFN